MSTSGLGLLHRRWRRRTSLLAAGVLEGGARARAEGHVARCSSCARERAAWRHTLERMDRDEVHQARLPLAFAHLETRVRARLAEEFPPAADGGRRAPARAWSAAAAVAVMAAVTALVQAPPGRPGRESGGAAPEAPEPSVAEPDEREQAEGRHEILRRMERSLAREQAARYLSEAQDLLVTVGGAPPCPRRARTVEVEDEARRSRELLARRAMVVELTGDQAASAQPLLQEVEHVLREVAALPSCVRRDRLDALEREIGRRRLLMKIDLLTRELQG